MAEMEAIAASVGSDVPFFLHGGQCKVTGTGDRIETVEAPIGPPYYVLILSDIHCSTRDVYNKLDEMGEFDDIDAITKNELTVIGYNRLHNWSVSGIENVI